MMINTVSESESPRVGNLDPVADDDGVEINNGRLVGIAEDQHLPREREQKEEKWRVEGFAS